MRLWCVTRGVEFRSWICVFYLIASKHWAPKQRAKKNWSGLFVELTMFSTDKALAFFFSRLQFIIEHSGDLPCVMATVFGVDGLHPLSLVVCTKILRIRPQ